MNKFIKILITLVLLGASVFAQSSNDAVVYIQGDKQTPFYVKMEGEMQERLGTNYAILNNLAAGEMRIQILFQQNQYPTQNFVINVPESGYRSFLLQKIDNNQFSLYDIDSKITLVTGNTGKDDILVTSSSIASKEASSASEMDEVLANASKSKNQNNALEVDAIATEANLEGGNPERSLKEDKKRVRKAKKEQKEDEIPEFSVSDHDKSTKKDIDGTVDNKVGKVSEKLDKTFRNNNIDKGNKEQEGRFIDDIELKNNTSSNPKKTARQERSKRKFESENGQLPATISEGDWLIDTADAIVKKRKSEVDPVATETNPKEVSTNQNTPSTSTAGTCSTAMDEEAFNIFAQRIIDRNEEELKLSFLRKNYQKKCFSTEQVRIISKNFISQSSRFEVSKLLYNNTIDKDNYDDLVDLFNTNFLKDKFLTDVLGK